MPGKLIFPATYSANLPAPGPVPRTTTYTTNGVQYSTNVLPTRVPPKPTFVRVGGITVDFPNAWMTCTCTKGQDPRFICKHKLNVLVKRQDMAAAGVVVVPMSRIGDFVTVLLGPPDNGLHEVSWHAIANAWTSGVVGYIREWPSRLALRELVWPYVLETALDTTCTNCSLPEAMAYPDDGAGGIRAPAIIATAIKIWASPTHVCPACDDSDLIPDPGKS